MSEEHGRRDHSHLQHEADRSRPHKKVSVMSYLAILFGAAFLLLLLSYFMQQRSSEQAISGLTDSVINGRTVGDLLEQNQALRTENTTLKEQTDKLEDELKTTQTAATAEQKTIAAQEKQLQAMDWFWRIQRAYSRGARSEAKALAQDFEATGLPSSLPTTGAAFPDAPSPAEQYDALLLAMGLKTTTP